MEITKAGQLANFLSNKTGAKLVLAFMGLNTLDALLTHVGLAYFNGYEGNPLLRAIIGQSWAMFWLWKIVLGVVASALFLVFLQRYSYLKKVLAGAVGLMIGLCIFNLIALF